MTAKPKSKRKTVAKPRTKLSLRTIRARATFLTMLRESCNVSESARAAGVARRTVYQWRDADAAFRADWEEAEEEAIDGLESEAWKRAKEGKSDRMLEILLKAHRPDKYRERVSNEHSGPGGGPIPFRDLSDAEIDARLAARLKPDAA